MPRLPPSIRLVPPAPCSNAWWQMQRRRFECFDQSHPPTPRVQLEAHCHPSKKSREDQACKQTKNDGFPAPKAFGLPKPSLLDPLQFGVYELAFERFN
jgi:hypothetical protein